MSTARVELPDAVAEDKGGGPVGERCDRCRYWECRYTRPLKDGRTIEDVEMEDDQPAGECRRHPPRSARGDTIRGGYEFPQTFCDDWCGEYRPRPAPKAVPTPPPADGGHRELDFPAGVYPESESANQAWTRYVNSAAAHAVRDRSDELKQRMRAAGQMLPGLTVRVRDLICHWFGVQGRRRISTRNLRVPTDTHLKARLADLPPLSAFLGHLRAVGRRRAELNPRQWDLLGRLLTEE